MVYISSLVNVYLHCCDALQTGVSIPAMVTQNYHIIVIDLQDHIPLQPSEKGVHFQGLLQ